MDMVVVNLHLLYKYPTVHHLSFKWQKTNQCLNKEKRKAQRGARTRNLLMTNISKSQMLYRLS